jgi:hypothetical protein
MVKMEVRSDKMEKGNGGWALGNTNNVETEMRQMRKKISTNVN